MLWTFGHNLCRQELCCNFLWHAYIMSWCPPAQNQYLLVGLQDELRATILCLHDFPSLSPLTSVARSGPPFVIRSVLIGWGCPGLPMVDLSERNNGVWGREWGDRANTESSTEKRPPCNHVHTGALRLPTLARHQHIFVYTFLLNHPQ